MTRQPKLDECQCCGFETMLTRYQRAHHIFFGWDEAAKAGKVSPEEAEENGYNWLCDLCASTFAGRSLDYSGYAESRPILQAICYVGNVILNEIRGTRRSAEPQRKA